MRGVPWRQPEPQLDLCTDASYQGWGAHLNDLTVSVTWKRRWQSKHINVLELEAFRRALQALATHVSGQCVRLYSDNPTTVSCLRREGGTKSLELTDITRQILLWADAHDTTLLPIHISGVRNVRADFLSRERKPHKSEWCLSRAVFNGICTRWGSPQIDLMATAENTQAARYFSPFPDNQALGVDVLSIPWDFEDLVYCFPPTAVMNQVLSKIRSAVNLDLILVAPLISTQPWFPVLHELSVGRPRPLARQPGDLVQTLPGSLEYLVHPRPELFRLAEWRVLRTSQTGKDALDSS